MTCTVDQTFSEDRLKKNYHSEYIFPFLSVESSVVLMDLSWRILFKMASIEVSLGWKRRREALLETLPRAARDLVRELDALHQALRDKDTVIQSLKTQITNLGGTVGGSGEGGGVISETERRSIQDRLNKVQGEMDAKKVAIKNLKLALEKIDITDNIDVRIRAAELEYELEREELNILNLKEESSVLNARLQDSPSSSTSNGTPGSQSSLYALLTSTGGGAALGGATLMSVCIPHTPGNPPFHVTPRPPLGCVIDWATDDTRLKKGDRLLEVNGENVVGRALELVTRLMGSAPHLTLVIARPTTGTGGRRAEGRLEKQLEDRAREIKDLVARLDKALKDKDTLKSDNTRLNHRIGYLEEQVSDLQSTLNRTREAALNHTNGEAIVTTSQPGATVIQVFQKGDQKLAVASPEVGSGEVERAQQYPTLPRLRSPDSSISSPSSSQSDSHDRHTLGQVGSSRPTSASDYRRRILSPRPDSKNEDSRPPSRTKPVPPKKPERLSLQRTTSLQSVEEGSATSRSSTTGPCNSRYSALQTWPSLDTDIHCRDNDLQSQTIYERGHERPNHHSHENIYDRPQERTHYTSQGHDHYSSRSQGDGSVRMIISGSPVSAEGLSRRPSPQGAASTPINERVSHLGIHRAHSPDAALHLDCNQPGENEQDVFRAEIYNHVGMTTTHFTSSHSHHHQHNHNHHQHSTHHNHYSLHTSHTPVPTSRSSTLSVATSPRPHEQWC
ncbi:uncharacterized protein LOC121854161 isoform X3 [Homarus americanus]|uniref:uncharacterized protein LOC121854161 isoform X3 n=1 Tax=Homarus americanus TaxID=6706 RepID=UPI001C454590|nr:uncharacterized protein LOC121854161 isoform X3 [Homarus americanus]